MKSMIAIAFLSLASAGNAQTLYVWKFHAGGITQGRVVELESTNGPAFIIQNPKSAPLMIVPVVQLDCDSNALRRIVSDYVAARTNWYERQYSTNLQSAISTIRANAPDEKYLAAVVEWKEKLRAATTELDEALIARANGWLKLAITTKEADRLRKEIAETEANLKSK